MQESQGSKTWLIGIIVVILLVVGGYVLMNRNTQSVSTTTPSTVSQPNSSDSMAADVMDVTIEAREFAFSPTVLMLKMGQPIRLTFKNTGKMPHNFIIDEINGAKTAMVSAGQTTTIEFTPTKAGTFKFYCGVGNHRAQGMEGTVTVQ